jgi:predicted SAM-dependent methyltransferase
VTDAQRLVNLGCGDRFHPAWINIDIVSRHPEVIAHDLSKGIPLAGDSVDVVYHAAVLEHVRPADALRFLEECRRVLRAGGVIRVGIPDLERIARLYLAALDAAVAGEPGAADRHDWMMLELIDQMVRETSGGRMAAYLGQQPLPNEPFIYERIGEEGRDLVRAMRQRPEPGGRSRRTLASVAAGAKRWARSAAAVARETLARVALNGHDRRALEIGRFRLAGEIHQWMYDRFSLGRLLTQAGFRDVRLESAITSRIAGWSSYHLDVAADGTVRKPDLLFMEAAK